MPAKKVRVAQVPAAEVSLGTEIEKLRKANADETLIAARVSALKRMRFERLAPKRVRRVLASIKGVRALAARATYDYSDAQRDTVLGAIANALKGLDDAFGQQGVKAEEFHL